MHPVLDVARDRRSRLRGGDCPRKPASRARQTRGARREGGLRPNPARRPQPGAAAGRLGRRAPGPSEHPFSRGPRAHLHTGGVRDRTVRNADPPKTAGCEAPDVAPALPMRVRRVRRLTPPLGFANQKGKTGEQGLKQTSRAGARGENEEAWVKGTAMARVKRKAKAAKAPRVPSDIELRRLKILSDYARARAAALDQGLLDGRLPPELRVRRPPKPDDAATRAGVERRVETMIELETRWRVAQLGVPYTDEIAARFEHFRIDSDHRRALETRHMLEEKRKRRERAAAAREGK